MRVSLELGLAIAGIVIAIILVVLDKTDKLKGGALLWLLLLAAIMTLPLAMGNTVVENSPAQWKWWLRALAFVIVGMAYWGIAIWISPSEKKDETATAHPAQPQAESPSARPQPIAQITEQFKIEQRAQIGVISVSLLGADLGGSIRTLTRLKNSGRTGANSVRFAIRCTSGSPESVLQDEVQQFMSARTYDPGEAVHPPDAIFSSQAMSRDHMTEAEVKDFSDGKLPTYVYGRIFYVDIFGEKHLTRFCSRWQGGSFGFCQKHNEVLHGTSVPTPLDTPPSVASSGLMAPRLLGRFLAFNVVQDNTGGFVNSDVYVKVQIENLGSTQSVAKSFKLTAQQDSTSAEGQLMTLPPSFTLFQNGVPVGTLRAEDSLDERAAHSIVRGTPVEGWLKFRFPSFSLDQALSMSWNLTFVDSDGKLTAMIGKSKGQTLPQLPPPDPAAKPPAF